MCDFTSVPACQLMLAIVRKETRTITVVRARTILHVRMLSIKINNIHHTTHCRRRKSLKRKSSRSRIDVTELKYTIPKVDLKELNDHVRISRGAKKVVC